MRDLLALRRDIAKLIAENPWTCVVRHRPLNLDDPATTFTFTGVVNRAMVATGRSLRLSQGAEQPVGTELWQIVAPYDTPSIVQGDEIVATDAYGTTHRFDVVKRSSLPYKISLSLQEGQ
jgi:hypothetical protein